MTTVQRRRPWWHPHALAGALERGRRPSDPLVSLGYRAARMAALGAVALVLARGAAAQLQAVPDRLDAAMAREAAARAQEVEERRQQHAELRADLHNLVAAVQGQRDGEAGFRATVMGLIQGRRCPDCRCPPGAPCPPCPPLVCPATVCPELPRPAQPAPPPLRPTPPRGQPRP